MDGNHRIVASNEEKVSHTLQKIFGGPNLAIYS